MDGIIVMDKPEDFTSFDMVAKMRRLLGTRKVGHAGTLDPMATGVLPIFVGRATKCCDILPDQTKRYTAVFALGYTTDTLDATGRVLSQTPAHVTKEQMEQVLDKFRGPIMQLPPMFSAIQINGKRLYDLARQGIEIEREKRAVTINLLQMLEFDEEAQTCKIDVDCSKGTYIRTLCADIGEELGCGATMTALRRTRAAGFTLEDSFTLEQAQKLSEEGKLADQLIPVEKAFTCLPKVMLDSKQEDMYRNGVKLDLGRIKDFPLQEPQVSEVRVYGEKLGFLGISEPKWETKELRLKKLFNIL